MLAILDYDAGNVESVRLALRHVGGNPVLVPDAAAAAGAERLVFPGVGAAGQCMRNLQARGFDRFIREAVARNVPVLAVCIGMQLLFDGSEEDGGVAGLGLLPGRVRLFTPRKASDKVPHMGWNQARILRPHPLLANPNGTSNKSLDAYFVHSYYVRPAWEDSAVQVETAADAPKTGGKPGRESRHPGVVYGATDYAGVSFASMAGTGSLFAAQFHPEKSGKAGLELLKRFLAWDGKTAPDPRQ